MTGYVYILKSIKDGKRYIGSTPNVTERIKQHNNGHVMSTKSRRPLVLLTTLKYNSIKEAAIMERKFKRSNDLLKRELKKTGRSSDG